jgi:1-phosphatidylinositol-3-phosphate 5-kinase
MEHFDLFLMTSGSGNYTFAKTLEYKAKQNLKSGKEVTVIPPNEYQTRFVNAMDGYFLACPGRLKSSDSSVRLLTIHTDKWSKAPHDQRDYSDPIVLRSVL